MSDALASSPRVLSRAPLALEQMIWLAMCNPFAWIDADGEVLEQRQEVMWYPAIGYVRSNKGIWILDPHPDKWFKYFNSTDELKRALDPLLRKVTP